MNKEHYELNIKILLEKIAEQDGVIKELVSEYRNKVNSMEQELDSLKNTKKTSSKEDK